MKKPIVHFFGRAGKKNNLYGRTMKLNLASLSKSYEEVVAMSNAFLKAFGTENIAEFYQMQSAIQLGLTDKLSQHIDNLTNTLGNDLFILFINHGLICVPDN